MPSLQQLLARHAPLLVLDAASSVIQAGWLRSAADARWAASNDEAGVGLFRCVAPLGENPLDAGAWVYCDGPGSILGIRTSAMAIRAWTVQAPRPVFTYHSLALAAHAVARTDLEWIADARRDRWHRYQIGSELRRVSASELGDKVATPSGFRAWATLPTAVEEHPYVMAELLARASHVDLFRESATPDAFLHDEPAYATWTPQIHRAP